MDNLTRRDVHLDRRGLRGRTFLLGNKRAFSLTLPAASGNSDTLLHPHKWFGAYLYGRKFLEAQLVREEDRENRLLSGRVQTSFTMGLTSARRDYEMDGLRCSEEYFVPDGIYGFASRIDGSINVVVEPEFDLRFYCMLNDSGQKYEVESWDNGALISAPLPSGRFDDTSETFLPTEAEVDNTRLFAAVEVMGDGAWSELLPPRSHRRRKIFPHDHLRHRFISEAADDAADHAPLWNQCRSQVYAPVRLHIKGHGTVVYGFGSSRDEALHQLASLRDSLIPFQAQKTEAVREILERATLETGSERVDTAYAQVLIRLMDALVARHATAEDTVLERPATMILAGNQYFHDSWKRDENIALGFLLSLGFYDLARDVIRDTWQLQDQASGRLPQRIRAGEEPPYHSSDGTLWALLRLDQYARCSGDESLLREKLPMVECFFRRSLERAVDGLLPSGRTNDPRYLWETWMDTPHTPRDGFPVEIQMLWIAALRTYGPIFEFSHPKLADAMQRAESTAWSALERYNVRGVLADSLDQDGVVRDLLTPNPYFCFGVGLDLGPEVEGAMRTFGRRQLAGRQGIVTLAPEDWQRVFSPEFLADRRHVRGRRMQSIGKFNYHRGVEWNWLSRFFVEAELKYGEPTVAFRTYLSRQVGAVLDRSGIGGISELHDLSGARGPEFQAWSMSSFLESLHAFAGVHIDVLKRRIAIQPQLPSGWPYLRIRKWYGQIPMDIDFSQSDERLSLHVTFPWGQPPDTDIDVVLVLPLRVTADHVDVRLDGIALLPESTTEPIWGGGRTRMRLSVPASVDIDITMDLRKHKPRLRRTA